MDRTTGFWSGETLEARLRELIPDPGKGTRVDVAAIELCLGREVFITGNRTKQMIPEGEQIAIPPGQMALLLTEERILMPEDALGFISMKSGVKLSGLVNISGFHVDPGYDGHLVFSVYNAGPISVPLTRGVPLFMIWFCSLDRATSRSYSGSRRGLESITDSMVHGLQEGNIPSPSMLQAQIKTMHDNITDEVGRVRDHINSEVATVASKIYSIKWWAGLIGAILGVAFSGIAVAIWQAWPKK